MTKVNLEFEIKSKCFSFLPLESIQRMTLHVSIFLKKQQVMTKFAAEYLFLNSKRMSSSRKRKLFQL